MALKSRSWRDLLVDCYRGRPRMKSSMRRLGTCSSWVCNSATILEGFGEYIKLLQCPPKWAFDLNIVRSHFKFKNYLYQRIINIPIHDIPYPIIFFTGWTSAWTASLRPIRGITRVWIYGFLIFSRRRRWESTTAHHLIVCSQLSAIIFVISIAKTAGTWFWLFLNVVSGRPRSDCEDWVRTNLKNSTREQLRAWWPLS